MEAKNPNEVLPGLFNKLAVDVHVDNAEETKEVDEVTSTPPSVLVSPTEKANCEIFVNLWEEGSLERFLEAPPPSHVTSLVLFGADSEFDPEMDLWARFVHFWSSRLESLQLRQLSLPLNCRLSELVAATSIRRLRCERISCSGPADVPNFVLQLDELRVDLHQHGFAWQMMRDPQRKATLRVLGSAKRLVIPQWRIEGTWESIFAADLLRMRQHEDLETHLTFTFVIRSLKDDHLLHFVTAVAASPSLSSIRVEDVTELFLEQVVDLAGEEDALKFFGCVESIERFSGSSDKPLLLKNFSTMRRLEFDKGEVKDPIEFPRSLEFLSIRKGLPAKAILSPFLTILQLDDFNCSAAELVRSLKLVNKSCPRLKSFEMHWICDSQGDTEVTEKVGAPQEDGVKFPNLRLLAFHMDDTRKVDLMEAVRLVFLEGLGLPRLSLTSLFLFRWWWNKRPPPFIDAGLLSLLIEGRIAETLCDVGILPNSVTEDAEELLATLNGMAKERKLIKTL